MADQTRATLLHSIFNSQATGSCPLDPLDAWDRLSVHIETIARARIPSAERRARTRITHLLRRWITA
jgi:hypothetical protein